MNAALFATMPQARRQAHARHARQQHIFDEQPRYAARRRSRRIMRDAQRGAIWRHAARMSFDRRHAKHAPDANAEC